MIGKFINPITSSGDWQRPSDWLAMPTGITSANQTFVGLHAVIENGDNYCAFRFTTSTGQYQVDWGDGTVNLVNSNVNAEHQYDFATYDTGNTTLTSRGYKQAIITVTAVSGNLLTCSFQQRYVTSPAQNQAYSTGFLDCILSMPNASSGTSIVIGGTTVAHRYCERFDIKTIGGCTSTLNFFIDFSSLQSVNLFNTQNVTSVRNMFTNCVSIKKIPLFNTQSVSDFREMLSNCSSLTNIPFFNMSSATSLQSTFSSCSSIISIPLFNTQNVTNMSNTFALCTSLQTIPLLNTSNVTSMATIFNGCRSLNSLPALSTTSITTSSGTDFGSAFASNAVSLNKCPMVFSRTVSLSNCQLSRDAIVEIFNNLVDRSATTSATITITGNWGVTALSAGDLAIATGKNWTVTT